MSTTIMSTTIVPKVLNSITHSQAQFGGVLAYACTIPGTIICFFVLVAFGIVACFPKARPHLDRVSFRLLTYTLVFNILFGIAFSVTASLNAPSVTCNVGAFSVNFTLNFATFFTTCIALNLQLVLVHGVNGKMMEKYYVIGTTILSVALTVPAFGLDQFGWDEQNSTCWWKNPNDKLRLRWLIGTQSFWIMFAATIEMFCSCVVLIWMFRFHLVTQRLTAVTPTSSYGRSTTKVGSNSRWSTVSSNKVVLAQASKYRNVILRIALYPIVSLLMNFPTAALDLNQTVQGIHTQLDFRLLVLDLVMYGVRTLAYGLLAFSDPSFVNAVREIRGVRKDSSTGDDSRTLSKPNFAPGRLTDNTTTLSTTTQGQMTVNVELQKINGHEDSTFVPDDKHIKIVDVYSPPSRGEGDSASSTSGRIAEDERWDDIEQDRKFQSQL